MKNLIIVLILALLIACSNKPKQNNLQENAIETSIKDSLTDTIPKEKIIGERIDGPANLRDTINGKTILSVNDNVLILTTPQTENWCLVGVRVKLTKKQINESKIYPNTELYSIENKKIGKTNDTVEVWTDEDNSGIIPAYTHLNNIKKYSVPEIALENEIQRGNLTLLSLKSYLYNFDFENYDLNKKLGYKQLFIYESIIVDPSPIDRISLLFDSKENLIGIVHSRDLNLKQFKSYKLMRDRSLTICRQIETTEIKRIIREINNLYQTAD